MKKSTVKPTQSDLRSGTTNLILQSRSQENGVIFSGNHQNHLFEKIHHQFIILLQKQSITTQHSRRCVFCLSHTRIILWTLWNRRDLKFSHKNLKDLDVCFEFFGKGNYPISTQRWSNVHLMSITFKWRWIDAKTTSCVSRVLVCYKNRSLSDDHFTRVGR